MTKLVLRTIAILLLCTSPIFAKTWTIHFGGKDGSPKYGYSPKELNVQVGDTIVWEGDFAMHPLSTVSIPSGAKAINSVSEGTSYSYTVQVAGNYSYQCDSHTDHGMVGSFSASAP